MTDPRTDQIAREAARLIEIGRADDIDQAINMAADALNARGAPLPGHGRVRKHAQAMSMQAMGEAAYNQKRLDVWRTAEEVMSAFEIAQPEAQTLLVGRAAQGHIDAGVVVHVRLYTDTPVGDLVRILEDFGYEGFSLLTAETLAGRVNQVQFEEGDTRVIVTRCPPAMFPDRGTDLFSGKPVESVGLSALRQQLKEHETQE